jgi:hypothetical protein
MTTVKEFQEWLNKFPEDTIIEVGIQEEPQGWSSYGRVNFETLKLDNSDIGNGWEFADFRNNKFVKPNAEYFGKCYLRLGESC